MSANPLPHEVDRDLFRGESITVTVAQAHDVPTLQATAAASWWATYGEYLSAAFIEDFLARAYNKRSLLAQIAKPNSCFLVVKSGEDVIGFGQVGAALPRHDAAPVAAADLHRLYLLPAWQGRGIGSRLLAYLEAWLREQGYTSYGAYVHVRNQPAQRFYRRQGFVRKPECDVPDEWYLVKLLTV